MWNGIALIIQEPLKDLKELIKLDISTNNIVNLEPLAGLKKLTCIYFGVNKVKSLEPLSSLEDLSYLSFRLHNQIREDLKPLGTLKREKWLTFPRPSVNEIQSLAPMGKFSFKFKFGHT